MNEKEFADAFCGRYKIKGDEICPEYCPVCRGGHNKDVYSFGLNFKKHVYKCQRNSCAAGQGTFKQLCVMFGIEADYYTERRGKGLKKEISEPYKKPTKILLTPTE